MIEIKSFTTEYLRGVPRPLAELTLHISGDNFVEIEKVQLGICAVLADYRPSAIYDEGKGG